MIIYTIKSYPMKFVVVRRRGISLLHKGESCGGLAEVAPTSIIQDSSEEIDCYYYIPKCALVPVVQNLDIPGLDM